MNANIMNICKYKEITKEGRNIERNQERGEERRMIEGKRKYVNWYRSSFIPTPPFSS